MTNLENTIIPKSDQLNVDDFITGPKTIKITGVKAVGGDQPVSISYENDAGKPFKPCKSMRRVLIQLWGGNGDNYIGKTMTLYVDPTIKWGKQEVGGIRISHMSHIEEKKSIMLTIRKGMRQLFKVKVLENFATQAAKKIKPLETKESVNLSDEDLKLWSDQIAAAKTKDKLVAIGSEIRGMGLADNENKSKLLEIYNNNLSGFDGQE